MNSESALRAEIVQWAKSLFDRGLTGGTSGNISARLPDGSFLVTPTGSCFGFLDPVRLSHVGPDWTHLSGDAPTKEMPLHRAFYVARPDLGAVVHLHSTYATAMSLLADTDPENAMPPITPYVVMRLGRVPMLPYFAPADPAMGLAVEKAVVSAGRPGGSVGILLANHGPVVAAPSLSSAVSVIEELEETAKLAMLTHGLNTRRLGADDVAHLLKTFT